MDADRRRFLCATSIAGGLFLPAAQAAFAAEDEEVSPAEDLMREHGVLKRCLLIYREALHRHESKEELPKKEIMQTAQIVRRFIEEYHEKLEEEHLFPRFRQAKKLVSLVDVLEKQHQAGRRQTDLTLQLSQRVHAGGNDDEKLLRSLQAFVRMYEPHEAREDTVLFPTLRQIVSSHEYDSLGEDFEKLEQKLLGSDGFEGMVDKVAGIEKSLGIYDLAQFTPE